MTNEVRPFAFVQLGSLPPMGVVDEEPEDPGPDIETIIAEARREGQTLGYQEGFRQGLEEQRAAIERLSHLDRKSTRLNSSH